MATASVPWTPESSTPPDELRNATKRSYIDSAANTSRPEPKPNRTKRLGSAVLIAVLLRRAGALP